MFLPILFFRCDILLSQTNLCSYSHRVEFFLFCHGKYIFYQKELNEKLKFMSYFETLFVSALSGQRTDKITDKVIKVYDNASKRITTGLLNEVLQEAVSASPPPIKGGKRLKIFYASQTGICPPSVVIFVNDKEAVHFSYERYIENCLRTAFDFSGTPVKIIFRNKNKTDIVPVSSFAPKSSILQFTSAVQSAARGIITVCAYVIFFSAFVGCLGATIREMGVPEFFGTVMFGFFELTSGVCSAAAIGNFKTAAVLCAFFAGWSGLSVHFQIMSICADKGISFRNYFLAKLCQGILCAGLMMLSLKFIYTREPNFAEDVFLYLQGQNIPSQIITKIAVGSALVIIILLFAIVFRNKISVNKKRKN